MAILGLNTGPFRSGAEEAKGIAGSMGEHIGSKIKSLVGVATFEELFRHAIKLGGEIMDLSLRLGIGTDAVQEWDYALKQNGSSIESAATFFEKLAISRGKALKGNDDFIKSFQTLGVSMDDLRTKRLEDIARKIAITFEGGDPQKLIDELRQVGGKGAGALAAAFSDGLPELLEQAHRVGSVMGEAIIDELDKAGDQMQTVWSGVLAFFGSIAATIHFILENAAATFGATIEGTLSAMDALLHGKSPGEAFDKTFDEFFVDRATEQMNKEARLQKRKDARTAALDEEKAEAGRKGLAEKIERHYERAKELREQAGMIDLTHAEKMAALQDKLGSLKERKDFISVLESSGDANMKLPKAETEEDIAKAELDLAQESKKKDKADKKPTDLNQLQKIGGLFVSPIENLHLDLARQTAINTHRIAEYLAGTGNKTGWQHSKH